MTGVQTCALPICVLTVHEEKQAKDRMVMSQIQASVNPTYETVDEDIVQGVSNPMYAWYKPGMSKQSAYQDLATAQPGTFVVRDGISSLDNPMYCLHVKTPQALIKDVNINGAAGEVTLVGGGVLGNRREWIAEAIEAALKELEASPNASKAYELTKLAEITKQKEVQAEIEQHHNARVQAQLQRNQIDAEEKRKTISHQSEQERRTAEYKARLDSELYQSKLEDQQKQIDQQLGMQHDQFMRQEEMRKRNNLELEDEKRRTMGEQARLERETAMARAKAESEGRITQERENVEVRLREMRARMAEERKTRMESIHAMFSGFGQGTKTLLEDRSKLTNMVGGLTLLALGVYGARAAARLGGNNPDPVIQIGRAHV